MLAKYKINIATIDSGSTATTINIPVKMEFQVVDTAEIVERMFVEVETQKAINPVLDYDKVRFIPVDENSKILTDINYYLYFIVNSGITIPTYYSQIGYEDADIKFERNNFKRSFLTLSFYDTDNPFTQNLVTDLQIFSMVTRDDLVPIGTPTVAGQPKPIPGLVKPASQIPVRFVLSNPLTTPRGFYEGYHIYSYKDEYVLNQPKSLYMRASYFNAKDGKITNLMTEPTAYEIDDLVHKLYTKYNLYRDTTGFYYGVDEAYSTNVSSILNPDGSSVAVKLYQIQTL